MRWIWEDELRMRMSKKKRTDHLQWVSQFFMLQNCKCDLFVQSFVCKCHFRRAKTWNDWVGCQSAAVPHSMSCSHSLIMESICFASFRSNASRRTKKTSQNISKHLKSQQNCKRNEERHANNTSLHISISNLSVCPIFTYVSDVSDFCQFQTLTSNPPFISGAFQRKTFFACILRRRELGPPEKPCALHVLPTLRLSDRMILCDNWLGKQLQHCMVGLLSLLLTDVVLYFLERTAFKEKTTWQHESLEAQPCAACQSGTAAPWRWESKSKPSRNQSKSKACQHVSIISWVAVTQ